MPSQTEENYLKTIFKLAEAAPEAEVSTNRIAELLQTKPSSVTDMLRRLGDKGLLNYQRYKGVSLTPEGARLALLTIRKHRLWEVFLVQKLGFSWDEVHDVAEEMEHIQSPLLVRRLDAFLGFPRLDPHGDPIPAEDGGMSRPHLQLLSELGTGETASIVAVKNTAPVFLQHLSKLGLELGIQVTVLDCNAYDQSLHIRVGNAPGTERMVSAEVSRNLCVSQ
ncbi:metal-dependent transcriptional regulator [Hymenobacter busanensis]|uniref:Transcriptional regulator MntR n=1 Tax=Hymenobacter busanensis TaxID=2607656 RepID=A0A7L4ZTL5_9BACT|nr:metal-dependent transcriptional regulator [Hymenobacter busanensis]KAA9339774.1 metal-dependent transcriptional regulator [Hymenobacter busanensis]QHJ06471.1 metal-dependent transcriptional regulator [Hymenobacter busanensis]